MNSIQMLELLCGIGWKKIIAQLKKNVHFGTGFILMFNQMNHTRTSLNSSF
jgi:hypothetical protein